MTYARAHKIATIIDAVHVEVEKPTSPPTRRVASVVGTYQEDLEDLMVIEEELGGLFGDKRVAALAITTCDTESYGKAALVG